jgi:hypothetical protein
MGDRQIVSSLRMKKYPIQDRSAANKAKYENTPALRERARAHALSLPRVKFGGRDFWKPGYLV